MRLPNLSYMATVGQLRHIQSRYESDGRRNPDTAVGQLLSVRQRVGCAIRGRLFLSRLRSRVFYHFLLARTRYYDGIFLEAARSGVGCIINIGCGSDTRAYRFAELLRQNSVKVVECDQPQAIRVKQRTAQGRWATDHVRYLPLDLNEIGWEPLAEVLEEHGGKPVLVMMEGVSTYVAHDAFEKFLRFLSIKLPLGSSLAYDGKVAGVNDNFGASERVRKPFRLPAGRDKVLALHKVHGLDLRHMETSAELQERLAPGTRPLNREDCLMRVVPVPRYVTMPGLDWAAAEAEQR